MENRKTNVDAEKFAYKFMESIQRDTHGSEDIQKSAKEALAAYLTAYYVALDFNNLENSFFYEEKKKKNVSTYQRILSELNKY
ncbi:hypothetical protein BU600_03600 [Staphylococcus arlettae]|uniref:hypothetical protein n=1 Tax=Staphylococcus TaxID=1279 RepID=UPI000D1F52ED|nr:MULTISPECIES: hypothetical protein [Staphylococcus]MCG7338895.1 hypothetical protein [Staphylococcus sp. ACRSN]MDW4126536.1 hypothetical protein [Staphylococcus saprophyticus]PTK11290.1 hypothetical protein BUZ75_10430 [Staphylococcus saprophyticus]PTK45892.1 hypothetical protein BUZ69_08790 [Staphylococcus saprophyticus]RIL32594.1 hypothetical protein BUY88_01385 [Staphylococcus equorum]